MKKQKALQGLFLLAVVASVRIPYGFLAAMVIGVAWCAVLAWRANDY